MANIPSNTALVLIDVQQGFDDLVWGKRNNLQAENNMARLLQIWRETERPVIHIQHLSVSPQSPLRADQPGCEFKSEVKPLSHEPIFQKTVNSAFIGTSLESHLRDNTIDSLVVVGLTTDHCVSTSTRMAANLGFRVFLVSDGTATFERTSYDGKHYTSEEIHATALASLHDEFAVIVDTDDIIEKIRSGDRAAS
ncbi:MAG: cysteine hydrolase family protein [Cyanobacteria bacterium J06635_15]